jgi:hypothetical protein
MANANDFEVQQVVTTFLATSAAIGTHLLEGAPLSDAELDSITNTLFGLQTSLLVWKKKNGAPDMPTIPRTDRSLRPAMSKPIARHGVSSDSSNPLIGSGMKSDVY